MVLVTHTPGHRNKFIDSQTAKVGIGVLLMMDVKTRWNLTLQLLEHADQLREFASEWLQNRKCSDYRPLFTSQDKCTIAKYVMEVLMPYQYWTLWISKWHTVRLRHIITVNNIMFDHVDCVMRAFGKKKNQWNEDLFFAGNLARQ